METREKIKMTQKVGKCRVVTISESSDWITMRTACRVTGLLANEIVTLEGVPNRRGIKRTRFVHLVHFPSLRAAIVRALRHRRVCGASLPTTRAMPMDHRTSIG